MPASYARSIRSSASATNGTTTMLVPVSCITAGSINSTLLPAPVGSTTITDSSRPPGLSIVYAASRCLFDRYVASSLSSRRSLAAICPSSPASAAPARSRFCCLASYDARAPCPDFTPAASCSRN